MSAQPEEFPEHVHEWVCDTGVCADCGAHRSGDQDCDHVWEATLASRWAACIFCGLMMWAADTPPDDTVLAG